MQLLNLYALCSKFGQLPRPGGLLNQSARLMYLFEQVTTIEAEREALNQKRANDERKANAGKR